MKKTILITGATDGIGLETAKMLVAQGHTLLLHGRNCDKLIHVRAQLLEQTPEATIQLFRGDFSKLSEINQMAEAILAKVKHIDVIINNAGVFVVNPDEAKTVDGYDIRFQVNTIAPYLLTKKLLPIIDTTGRVVNLSSAAQMPVNFSALQGGTILDHSEAYAQSKLAIIMWGLYLSKHQPNCPSMIAVNPKSFLGSKMVKTAYGRQGYDLKIGGDILCRAALSDEFANAGGKYFDNDYGVFSQPHPSAKEATEQKKLVEFMNQLI